MKDTLFAEVNKTPLRGADVLRSLRRLLAESEGGSRYADTPNDDNRGYLNAEALRHAIERLALRDAAIAEGFAIGDDAVDASLYELRSACEDEAEWESLLSDLGLEEHHLRQELLTDLLADALFNSRLQVLAEPEDNEAEDYYRLNKERMRIPQRYTFLELEASSNAREAAAILSLEEGGKILAEAKARGIPCSLSEDMEPNNLPEALQNVLADLAEGKIASLPADDGSLVLIKMLRKTEGRSLELEEALPGLKEYLAATRSKALADDLIEDVLEKAEVIYHNTDLLKKLK